MEWEQETAEKGKELIKEEKFTTSVYAVHKVTSVMDCIFALKNGISTSLKKEYDKKYDDYRYHCTGKTLSGDPLEVTFCFDEERGLIVLSTRHL